MFSGNSLIFVLTVLVYGFSYFSGFRQGEGVTVHILAFWTCDFWGNSDNVGVLKTMLKGILIFKVMFWKQWFYKTSLEKGLF